MLTINRLREFLLEAKSSIEAVKYTQLIITDEEFVTFLKERKPSDNMMLFAVMPDHGLSGREDSTKYENYLQFMLLEKSATLNLKHDEKLDLFARVQAVVKKFIDLILELKANEDSDFCSIFEDFNEESVEIKLFWDGLQCRGYEIFFNMKS